MNANETATFADKIVSFNRNLKFTGTLPSGIKIMNPFKGNNNIMQITKAFYNKYYSDNKQRKIILGINPGRFGAGVTGIPFTDTKRLTEKCSIPWEGAQTHEPSSVFVYKVINAYGGVKKFYSAFYINSICPLGFVKSQKTGKDVNYNYYDSKKLTKAATPFIVSSLKKQIKFGIDTSRCFCMGNGKNYDFLCRLNDKHGFFEQIVPLEHPRYIVQYKAKKEDEFLIKYLDALKS